jgi:hypothetical protein
MDQTALYEEDIYAWSQHQARVLRGLAEAGLRLPNDLDLEHVAEEIEEVGNEQRFQAESNLIQALTHLIKIVALPEDQAVRHWRKEIGAFLLHARRRYRPSMRRAIDMAALWSDARRLARQDLEVDGHAMPPLPEACPFELEELVEAGADPQGLARQLAGTVEALRHSA